MLIDEGAESKQQSRGSFPMPSKKQQQRREYAAVQSLNRSGAAVAHMWACVLPVSLFYIPKAH